MKTKRSLKNVIYTRVRRCVFDRKAGRRLSHCESVWRDQIAGILIVTLVINKLPNNGRKHSRSENENVRSVE